MNKGFGEVVVFTARITQDRMLEVIPLMVTQADGIAGVYYHWRISPIPVNSPAVMSSSPASMEVHMFHRPILVPGVPLLPGAMASSSRAVEVEGVPIVRPSQTDATQVRTVPADICEVPAPQTNTLEKDHARFSSSGSESCDVAPPDATNTLYTDRFNGAQFCIPTHDEIINGLTKFTCKMCGMEFTRDVNLEMHKWSHGSQYRKGLESFRGKQPKLELPFYCCAAGCRNHINHPRPRPLKCFKTLRTHYKRTHCEKIYKCEKCKQQCAVKADHQTHVKNCGKVWWCKCGSDYKHKRSLTDHIKLKEKHGQGEDHGVDNHPL